MTVNLIVEIKSRWWLPVYLKALLFYCVMTCREPDYDKLKNFIAKYGLSQKFQAIPCTSKQ